METRQAVDHACEEVARGVAAIAHGARVPHGDLVDLERGDRLHLLRHELRELLDEEKRRADLRVAAAALDESTVAVCLRLEDAAHALCLGLVLEHHGVGLALCLDAPLVRLCGGRDLDALPLDLLRRDEVLGHAGKLLLALCDENRLGRLRCSDLAAATALGLHFAELRLGLGHLRAREVLARHCGCLGLRHANALLLLRGLLRGHRLGGTLRHADLAVALGRDFRGDRLRLERRDCGALLALRGLLALFGLGELLRHADLALAHGERLARGAVALLLRDLDLGAVDRLGGGALADRLDVAALVRDVADIHIDQLEADLVDLLLDIGVHERHELLAVLVDLLDRKRGDHEAELAEDDVLRLVADLVVVEVEEPLRSVVHQHGIGRHADGEGRRHIHADVVERQRARERNVDHHRLERQIRPVLDERPHERAAAVDAAAGAAAADAAEDHEDAVRRAAAIAAGDERGRHHDDEQRRECEQDEEHGASRVGAAKLRQNRCHV